MRSFRVLVRPRSLIRRGAAFAAGPGFERLIAPPYREPGSRDAGEALKVLLDAGADPNAKSTDGTSLLHQAVTARRTDVIRALVARGARLDITNVNKDNLTPLQLAEKPEPPPPPGNNTDSRTWKPRRDSREQVIATLRELMHLGPDDPAPAPAPLPEQQKKTDSKADPKSPETKLRSCSPQQRLPVPARFYSRKAEPRGRRPRLQSHQRQPQRRTPKPIVRSLINTASDATTRVTRRAEPTL